MCNKDQPAARNFRMKFRVRVMFGNTPFTQLIYAYIVD
jgi:hypothetical protein